MSYEEHIWKKLSPSRLHVTKKHAKLIKVISANLYLQKWIHRQIFLNIQIVKQGLMVSMIKCIKCTYSYDIVVQNKIKC